MKNRITAIIPARAGSIRVPHKNLQVVNRVPLVDRKIQQLQQAAMITEIVLGTDSRECMEIAKARSVRVLERDEYHCDESRVSANEMIYDLVSRIDADIILWAHCTNPFLYSRHYDAAIETFLSAEEEGYDSVMSVQKIQSHMWSDEKRPLNYDPYLPRHTLARYLKPVFFQDGGIFIQRKVQMMSNSYFFGRKPHLFEVDFPYSHDINTSFDIEIANAITGWLDKNEHFIEKI